MAKLAKKVAVITGGSSGIGLITAQTFVEHGARVAIFGRDQKALDSAAASLGNAAIAVQGDVTKAADLERLFQKTAETFGKVDIVFANAGAVLTLSRPLSVYANYAQGFSLADLGRTGERRQLVVVLGLDPAVVHGERLGGEGLVADDGPVERDDGRHALDDQLVQRAAGPLQRLVAGRAGDDELFRAGRAGAGEEHLAIGGETLRMVGRRRGLAGPGSLVAAKVALASSAAVSV